MDNRPIVAAFDFDGTMTYRDTLLPFLCFTKGNVLTYWKLTLELHHLLGFIFGINSRQQTKEAILTRFLAGAHVNLCQKAGEEFANSKLPKLIKPEAFDRFLYHLKRGDRCVLVSANLDLYLKPWAKQVGFRDAICSECEVDAQGRLTGKLKGKNCWGPEKTRRLTELLGPKENYILYAYGDSSGDKELLALADYPYFKTMQN